MLPFYISQYVLPLWHLGDKSVTDEPASAFRLGSSEGQGHMPNSQHSAWHTLGIQ